MREGIVFASGLTKPSIAETLSDFVFTKYFQIDCAVHLSLLLLARSEKEERRKLQPVR